MDAETLHKLLQEVRMRLRRRTFMHVDFKSHSVRLDNTSTTRPVEVGSFHRFVVESGANFIYWGRFSSAPG